MTESKTEIEFVEYVEPDQVGMEAIVPRTVLINGNPVLVLKDSVKIEHPSDPEDALKVTLTLLPSRVEFKSMAVPPRTVKVLGQFGWHQNYSWLSEDGKTVYKHDGRNWLASTGDSSPFVCNSSFSANGPFREIRA